VSTRREREVLELVGMALTNRVEPALIASGPTHM
jgi:hypothetical protein